MTTFLTSLTDRGATPALIHTLSFTEARARMVAENVANIHTPGYRTKTLDVAAFQAAMRKALNERGSGSTKPLLVRSKDEVRTLWDGQLRVTPSLTPPQNALFHDGTNQSIERQMADLAEAGMTHDLATALLRDRFDRLTKAVRGTV